MIELPTASEIEARRQQLGLSRKELCRRVGIAGTTMTRWINGETQPSIGLYRRIIETIEAAESLTPEEAAGERGTA